MPEQHLLIGPQTAPYRAQEAPTETDPSTASKKGFGQAQGPPRQTHRHTPLPRGVHAAKPEAVRTHVPKPCAQPLADPLPKVGARCWEGRVIGRGGAHGATASRFPVSCKAGARGTSSIPVLGPKAARMSQYTSGRGWMMTAIPTPERSA